MSERRQRLSTRIDRSPAGESTRARKTIMSRSRVVPIMTVGQARSPGCQPARRERIQKMGKRKSARPRVVEALEERQLLSGGLGYLLAARAGDAFPPALAPRKQPGRCDRQSGVGGWLAGPPASAPLSGFSGRGSAHQQRLDGLNRHQQYRERKYSDRLRRDLGCRGGRDAGIEHHGRGRALALPSTTLPASTSTPSTTAPTTASSTATATGTATVTAAPTPASTPAVPPLALSRRHPGTSQRGGIDVGFERHHSRQCSDHAAGTGARSIVVPGERDPEQGRRGPAQDHG